MTETNKYLMKEQTIFVNHLPKWLPEFKQQWVWINGTEINFSNSYEEARECAHREGYLKDLVFIEEIVEGYQLGLFPGKASHV